MRKVVQPFSLVCQFSPALPSPSCPLSIQGRFPNLCSHQCPAWVLEAYRLYYVLFLKIVNILKTGELKLSGQRECLIGDNLKEASICWGIRLLSNAGRQQQGRVLFVWVSRALVGHYVKHAGLDGPLAWFRRALLTFLWGIGLDFGSLFRAHRNLVQTVLTVVKCNMKSCIPLRVRHTRISWCRGRQGLQEKALVEARGCFS